jgi:hypothetical protein
MAYFYQQIWHLFLQKNCFDSFAIMSDFTIDQSRDRSVSDGSVMDAIRVLLYGLSNTLLASSDSAKVPNEPSLKDINVTLSNTNKTLLPSEARLEVR